MSQTRYKILAGDSGMLLNSALTCLYDMFGMTRKSLHLVKVSKFSNTCISVLKRVWNATNHRIVMKL